MIYLLDTCVVINFSRRKRDWVEVLRRLVKEKDTQLAVSVITYAELRYGATRSVNPQKERDKIKSFIDDFLIEIIPITAEVADEFAELKREVEKTGAPLDDFDLLIAATAKVNDATLLTDNQKHFERVGGIKIYENCFF
ncbi:MAG: type II toxin-antitoxin system VapC family toxin [bacterium]|nr:type II toxin-antitoxin system VapC family toxin [bacterium]